MYKDVGASRPVGPGQVDAYRRVNYRVVVGDRDALGGAAAAAAAAAAGAPKRLGFVRSGGSARL